jgi:hypothetical protein
MSFLQPTVGELVMVLLPWLNEPSNKLKPAKPFTEVVIPKFKTKGSIESPLDPTSRIPFPHYFVNGLIFMFPAPVPPPNYRLFYPFNADDLPLNVSKVVVNNDSVYIPEGIFAMVTISAPQSIVCNPGKRHSKDGSFTITFSQPFQALDGKTKPVGSSGSWVQLRPGHHLRFTLPPVFPIAIPY